MKSHLPRKRFGQHFLCDQAVIQQIVMALNPQPNQHLVEIGPGQGAITTPVLKRVQRLEVIELDRDLVPVLEQRHRGDGELVIHLGDVLEFDFARIKSDDRPLRVFGNLPYNISTPLLFHLLTYAGMIEDMVFMVQKEVADRMAASVGDDAYGRLSVMLQYYCRVEHLFDVAPDAFYPPPKVQSSIVRLIPHHACPHVAVNFALFESIVKHAFNQRRKTIRNSLKTMVSDAAWDACQLDPQLRAEALSVADFVALSNVVEARK